MTAVVHMELLVSSGMQVDREEMKKTKKEKERRWERRNDGRKERKMEGREAEGKHLADFCTSYFKKLSIFSWINYW